jgi:hypothetical protein
MGTARRVVRHHLDHRGPRKMTQPSAPKDIEKMVAATAKAMALAEHRCGTPRMVKLYLDDARKVLLDVAKSAKRQKWTVEELILALDPPKPKPRPREKHQDPPRRGGP